MIREERIGGQRLILGDALSIIPTLKRVDAIVGDPPYSSGGFTQSAISKAAGQGLRSETIRREGWFAGDAMTASGAAFLLREVALACYCASTSNATLTFFTDWRVVSLNAPAIESALWRFQNLLVWDKGNAGLGSGFRAQHELAMHFSKGAPKYASARHGNVLKGSRVPSNDREHGCQKPVELMVAIVETVAQVGGLVLDPFMGSGSTLVACAAMRRRGIGIEIDPEYFAIACKRVDEASRQPDLFIASPAAAKQEAMDL